MADNIELSSGSGGAIVKTDEDGSGNHWQYVKQAFGADNTQTRVTAAVGLPVNLIDIEGNAVALNTGVVDAGTLRVTLATDVALPAGTNAIGKLAANSGVDIGDVDVLTLSGQTLTFGAGAVAAGTPRVTLASDDPAVADLASIKTAVEGTLTVGSHAVTNAGTFAVQVDGAALTALQLIDNIVLAEDAAHQNGDPGVQMLAVRSDTASTKVGANGDYHPLLVDADGKLHVNPGSVTIVDGGGSITIDGTITANAGTNLNTSTLAVESGGNLDTIAAALGGTLTVGLPSGAATEAAQSTANTALSNIQTAVELIDNAISGSEMQVDVVAALPAGTNAIGKLAANSGVDIGDVDVTSQPARAATTDTITAKLATDAIQNGTTALTPKFAAINVASSGDNTLVAAVTDKKIRVLAVFLVAGGDVVARFESGAGGTALTGQMDLTTNSGFVLPFNPVGWFETAASTLLNLELDGAVGVDGSLVYVEV